MMNLERFPNVTNSNDWFTVVNNNRKRKNVPDPCISRNNKFKTLSENNFENKPNDAYMEQDVIIPGDDQVASCYNTIKTNSTHS